MIRRSMVRPKVAAITEMMMTMMISSSLRPDVIILSVTSSLQELLPTSLLTIQEYSPDIYKENTIGLLHSYSNDKVVCFNFKNCHIR